MGESELCLPDGEMSKSPIANVDSLVFNSTGESTDNRLTHVPEHPDDSNALETTFQGM